MQLYNFCFNRDQQLAWKSMMCACSDAAAAHTTEMAVCTITFTYHARVTEAYDSRTHHVPATQDRPMPLPEPQPSLRPRPASLRWQG
mmetsp:Transcript_72936/g.126496  ORF Transcript_72936/g.126496 Transcript_72936/m.126496 type:complete len:87 (+) Transcript_72936:299-559(+)